MNVTVEEVRQKVKARAVEVETASLPGEEQHSSPFAFNVLSGKDLLALPRPEWRIKGVLPQSGIAVVWGPSRSGKTFAALDLALALPLAKEWFGWKTTACDVLYICLESVWGMQGRLKAWALDKSRSLPANVQFIIEPFDLQSSEHISAIIQAAPHKGILVIDTLNRAAPGADENSSRDMSLIINAASKIQEAMQGVVLLVAHSGKDGTKGIRGHSSLFAALDASIEVGRNGDVRYIRLDKVKEAEDGTKKFFRLKSIQIGTDEDGEAITSCVVDPLEGEITAGQEDEKPLSKNLQYALDSLHAALEQEGKDGIHVDAWRPYFYAGHFADNDEAKKKAFQRARNALLDKNKISVFNDSYKISGGTLAGHVPHLSRPIRTYHETCNT